MAGWYHTTNKNKSTFSAEKIPITRSMDARFDHINEKIKKNYEELQAKIKQTSDNLTSTWTQITSRMDNTFLTLQEDQKKNQAILTAILDKLQISNDPHPNSPRTPKQPNPLFNMSSSNQCYKYRVGEYIAEGPKRNYRIYRQKCQQTSAIYRQT